MANFVAPWNLSQSVDPATMKFDPLGFMKIAGQAIGIVPPDQDQGIAPPEAPAGVSASSAPPAAITNLGIMQERQGTPFMQNPGGYLAEKLGQTTTSQAEHEMRMQNAQPQQGDWPVLSMDRKELDPNKGLTGLDRMSLDDALGKHIVDPVNEKTKEFEAEDKAKS